MAMTIQALDRYARALREAANAEHDLMGSLLTPDEALADLLRGRADRVEGVLDHYLKTEDS